jgi:hypothetical protein
LPQVGVERDTVVGAVDSEWQPVDSTAATAADTRALRADEIRVPTTDKQASENTSGAVI